MQERPYYYNRQIASYLAAFMALFLGLHTKSTRDGSKITVPIHFSSADRVYSAIVGQDGNQNKLMRLPAIAAHITNISWGDNRWKGSGTSHTQSYMEAGGVFPNDIQAKVRYMPVPVDLTVDLTILTSNMDSMFQIIEQIIPIFNPSISVQRNDEYWDWARQFTVTLQNMQLNDIFPRGTDRGTITSTLTFQLQIWIGIPSTITNAIQTIMLRMGEVGADVNLTDGIVSVLDEQGAEYVNISPDLNTLFDPPK